MLECGISIIETRTWNIKYKKKTSVYLQRIRSIIPNFFHTLYVVSVLVLICSGVVLSIKT